MTGSTKHDILLGEYTLGLLSASETAQAHTLLGNDQQAVATALAWENSLLELTDLLAPVDPSPLLLQRIQGSLGHDMAPTPASLYRKADNGTRIQSRTPVNPMQSEPVATPPASTDAPSVAASAKPASAPAPAAPAPATAPVQTGHRVRTEPAISREYLDGIQQPAETQTSHPATSETLPKETKASGPKAPLGTGGTPPQAHPETQRVDTRKKTRQGSIWFWRLTTLAFAAASLALALIPSQPVPPPVTILQVAPTQAAILQAPGQSSTPAWVVTVDPERNILMSPKVRSDIPADASVQLWTHSKSMPAPRSLGLIDPNQPVTVPAALMGNVSPDQIFEMTLEPKGGSPTASPSGPILFIGRIVTFGAQPQPDTTTTDGA